MCNYTIEPKEVSVDIVKSNGFTFASNKLKTIKDNGKYFTLSEPFISLGGKTITKNKLPNKIKYVEIGSIENNIGTINPELNYNKNNVSQSNLNKPKIDDILISTVRTYLGGIGIVKEKDLYSSKALLIISDCKYDKHYLFGVLKTSYFIQQSLLIENNGSYPRMDKSLLSKIKIPLPPSIDIEKLVSYITQNIIDKEQQIKNKNILIDNLIEEELKIIKSNNNISADKDTFIKNGFRFNAGLYNKNFLDIYNSIINYKGGWFNIGEKYDYKRGQNLQESNIGKSHYSDNYIKGYYKMVTAQDFSENRTISNIRYLGSMKQNLLLLNDSQIIVNATGKNTGRTIYFNNQLKENIITNINQWVFTYKNGLNIILDTFISAIISYFKRYNYFESIKDASNGGFIVIPHIKNFINIPNFKEEKQKEISKEYFNEVLKKENTINTYLANEKLRNKDLGIWQLNQEIFTLKEQLEEIVEYIVFNKDIDLNKYLNY